MAKIVDPDQLNDATEVVYSTAAKTLQLLATGNLDDGSPGKTSGATGQAVYSASKDHWLASATLRRHRSPIDPVFDASYRLKDGWDFADVQTTDLIRDAGFQVTDTGQEFACVIGLQEVPTADQAYYQNVIGFTTTQITFDKTGNLNEMFEIFDGGLNDQRDFLKVFTRIQGRTYSEGDLLTDQGLAALTFVAYRIPLGTANDPNIIQTDGFIDGNVPYTNMTLSFIKGSVFNDWADSTVVVAGEVVRDTILQANGSTLGTWWFTVAGGTTSGTGTADDVGVTDWEAYTGERQIGLEWYAFNRIIDGAAGTDIQCHEWAQRQLRRVTDINNDLIGTPNQDAFGAVNGDMAIRLTRFEGGIKTFPGVFIDDIDPSSRATAEFFDVTVNGGGLDLFSVPLTSTGRTFPFSSAGLLVFSQNAVDETNVDTFFDMYFDHTSRDTNTDYTLTAPSTNTAVFNSPTLDLTTRFTNGDYCQISGFATGDPILSNGIFQVSSVAAASMTITKTREPGAVLVTEVTGQTVNLDADPFDTPDAVIVQDDTDTNITGTITQVNEPFTFAYDTNVQGGRITEDALVHVVAQGLNDSKWVEAIFTITRATGLSFPVNLGDESVYNNPP